MSNQFSIKLPYISFQKRIFQTVANPAILFLFAATVAIIFLQINYIATTLSALLLLFVTIQIIRKNIFYITQLDIDENTIKVSAIRFNKLYIDGTYNIANVDLNLITTSYSKRGKEVALEIIINGTKYRQYEIAAWSNKEFNTIIKYANQ